MAVKTENSDTPKGVGAMKPVEIVWLDSGLTYTADEAWVPVGLMVSRAKLASVRTIGYLAAEDKEAYYVVQTYDPLDGQGINLMVIAKKNVSEFNHLRRR